MRELYENSSVPLISVVIPSYNEEFFLADCLKSLEGQDFQGNFEVIVVDNNSSDRTTEVAKKYGAKVVFEPKRGIVFARQAGFEVARGEIIFTTDADSIVPKNWLTQTVLEFKRRPSAAAISGMFDYYDGDPCLRFLIRAFCYPLFVSLKWYSAVNLAVKKEAFIKIGGFNLNLIVAEDIDLCRRLKKIRKVYLLPFSKVKCSARRFNKLGIAGGLWYYARAYFKIKIADKNPQAVFQPCSDLKKTTTSGKVINYFVISTRVLSFLFGVFSKKIK